MRAFALLAGAGADLTVSWCAGNQVAYETCHPELCEDLDAPKHDPVDAEWGEWNEWGECSCQFLKERSRPVQQHHQYNGKPIDGTIIEAASCTPDLTACNIQEPVDCKAGDWLPWDAECSCGRTQIYRERTVLQDALNCGKTCDDLALNETKACSQEACTAPVDCSMTQWSEWDDCSVSCGGGQRQHTRWVETYPQNGGAECEGTLIETHGCNVDCCDDKKPVDCVWGGWSPWSACSAECDGGERTRQRMLQTPPRNGGAWCDEGSVREVEGCSESPCNPESPVNGKWASWGAWGSCSATCGGGFQWRERTVAVEAAHGGTPAKGQFQEYQACSEEVCVHKDEQDCKFAPWAEWGGCSMACNGYHARSRVVLQHAKHGGQICDGALRMIEACNVDSPVCNAKEPKPCEWLEWGSWQSCSATCGGGTSARERGIKKDQEYSGEGCSGELKQIRSCSETSCNPALDESVDCAWNGWSEWGACSRTCGGGQKERWRGVKVPAKNAGKLCVAQDSLEVAPCHLEGCGTLVYCSWAEWRAWGTCSTTCGSGERQRARSLAASETRPEGEALATSRFSLAFALAADPAISAVAAVGGAIVGLAGLSLYQGARRRADVEEVELEEPLVE